MYVVIFRATVAKFDDAYSRMAEELRKLALAQYKCLEFTSSTEGNCEIALSYWQSLEHIREWKNDPLHRRAQKMGKDIWYSDFSVEICELTEVRRFP